MPVKVVTDGERKNSTISSAKIQRALMHGFLKRWTTGQSGQIYSVQQEHSEAATTPGFETD